MKCSEIFHIVGVGQRCCGERAMTRIYVDALHKRRGDEHMARDYHMLICWALGRRGHSR